MTARRLVLWCLCMACLVGSGSLRGEEPPRPLPALDLQDGDSLVFLGDSITHQVLYTQYVEDYFYTRFPGRRLEFHNAGVGGARAWDALQRFDRDVAAFKPKYVTVLLGMNDGSYRPYDEPTFVMYRTDMTALLGRIKDCGAVPVLMTPTMFDARAARLRDPNRANDSTALYNSVLAYYGTWLREMAVENGWGFVDMWGPLNTATLEQRKTQPDFTLIADAVHPDPPGQLIMAAAIIHDLGLPREVSHIGLKANDAATIDVRGGAVSNLQLTAEGGSFTWTAESLPWVVPNDAQPGAALVHLGNRLGRESLSVAGLAEGRYALSIDGAAVGTYSAIELSAGVELQDNPATPQHQQAMRVAEINQRRNFGPVVQIRNAWGQFQGFARVQQAVENLKATNSPVDEPLQKQFEELQASVADLDARVAQLQAEAAAIVEEIYQANAPQPHEYVLRREG